MSVTDHEHGSSPPADSPPPGPGAGFRHPSTSLANVSLGIGLFSAIGPVLHVVYWIVPVELTLSGDLPVAGALGGFVGVPLSLATLIVVARRPDRHRGRWRAGAGLLTSIVGLGWLAMSQMSIRAQYGPWGSVTQIRVRGDLQCVSGLLENYAAAHEGAFVTRLADLIGEEKFAASCLRVDSVSEDDRVTNLHYVIGLDVTSPRDWIVVYAHPELFDDEGGAILTIDGAMHTLAQPEFIVRLERFQQEFESANGVPPTIAAPQ